MRRLALTAEPYESNPAERPQRFLVFLLLLAAVLLACVFAPLAQPLLLAAVAAAVTWPLQKRLAARLRGRRTLAATLLVGGAVLATLLPLAWLVTAGLGELRGGVRLLDHTLRDRATAAFVADLPGPLRTLGGSALTTLQQATGAFVEEAHRAPPTTPAPAAPTPASTAPTNPPSEGDGAANGKALAEAAKGALAATWSFAFGGAMFLIAWFCLLTHGDRLVAWLGAASPLRRGQTEELLREFRDTASSLTISTLVTSFAQAAAATVGYLIGGVPKPLFFAALTFVAAFIPAFGAAGVSLATALLLLVEGRPFAALFVAIWSVTLVGLIDNVLKPLLMRSGTGLDGTLVFFALVGGIAAFGAIGLVLGPLALCAFTALVRIQRRADGVAL